METFDWLRNVMARFPLDCCYAALVFSGIEEVCKRDSELKGRL